MHIARPVSVAFFSGLMEHLLSELFLFPTLCFLLCAASRWRSHSLAEEIQPEIWIAQELRRIGDEFNASYCPRRVILLFLLSISLRTVSKREKLNHIWKLALWQVFCSLKCRKGCAGGCRLLPPRHERYSAPPFELGPEIFGCRGFIHGTESQ